MAKEKLGRIQAPDNKAVDSPADTAITQREFKENESQENESQENESQDNESQEQKYQEQEYQEIDYRDKIIAELSEKLAKYEAKEAKDPTIVEFDGEKYKPIDDVTQAIHHNGSIVKIKDFSPEITKEYIQKGFLVPA